MKRKIKILGTGKKQVIFRRGDDIVLKIPRTLVKTTVQSKKPHRVSGVPY